MGRCDVEVTLPDGFTRPLHTACRRGFERVAILLLDNGADHRTQDVDGLSPLHMAAKEGKATIVEVRRGLGLRLPVLSIFCMIQRLRRQKVSVPLCSIIIYLFFAASLGG